MKLINIFFKILITSFSILGKQSGVYPCGGWWDEPEVPKEITDLHK
ncbi:MULTISPECIES: cyclic lactone autoinducer peptide AgrD [Staphylococcus]|uniref:Cyclic lactone autoinducer peptide n=1 Tax=Staphylococcus pettenkoferi TaxID=170573 RepID=A0A1Z3TZS4_9STAP|nr:MULTISPECIES: cyclic lactone autoinducer peptide [Staphylococcus]ASE36505.1 cyclic lactone autoinducer peptide [Staphylococcus pettenkoferi]EHM70818.1 agrD protein [Staphylococcus pettenkoferi VCU012]MBX8994249.1 cyclic lactone autoinducer peptide [Staphylococcus pettenkoferi]MCI2791969.1 cyclic lactone autoinducer peptide [Staphylococcus pettenkoferi]MCI2804299.1 cyclic lactone autoinducer peptide [Staphylococcus pettenkoferi]